MPIERLQREERSHFLAIIQSFRTIETPQMLLEACEGLRAAFALGSQVRYAWANAAPELLRELWGVLDRIGGTIPQRPEVLKSNPRVEEAYIQEVLQAIADIIRWCDEKREAEGGKSAETTGDSGPVPPTGFPPTEPATRVPDGSEPIPIAESSTKSVILYGRQHGPKVRGKIKNRLTNAQYDVVLALLQAGDRSLTKDQLNEKSKHGDARKVLRRLFNSDSDWESVIQLAGKTGRGYQII
jgi:hypothetical protein